MVADDAKTTLTIPTFNGQHYTRWKKLVDLWRKATNVAEEILPIERERTNRKEETMLQMRQLKTLGQRMSRENTQDSEE